MSVGADWSIFTVRVVEWIVLPSPSVNVYLILWMPSLDIS